MSQLQPTFIEDLWQVLLLLSPSTGQTTLRIMHECALYIILFTQIRFL